MEASPRPTLADVAKVAGVATMTASRVLSGSAYVDAAKAERVRKAAAMLRYQPNETARSLRAQRSRIIGIIASQSTDPLTAASLQVMVQAAQQRGYSVILSLSNDDQHEELAHSQAMMQRAAEGVIVLPVRHGASKLSRGNLGRMHVVSLGRKLEDPSFDAVVVHEQQGAKLAVEHLRGHGISRIIYVGSETQGEERSLSREGYRIAMLEAGLRTKIILTREDSETLITDLQATMSSAGRKKVGIIAEGERELKALYLALQSLSLAIPNDVALVSLVESPIAELIPPGISTIRVPYEDLGRLAVDILFGQIESEDALQDGTAVGLPVEFVARKSCGCGAK